MNTNKRFIFIQLSILLLFGSLSCVTEIVETGGGSGGSEPEKVYVVNNAEFGIYSNKTNARSTNDGINAVIKKAKKEGYNVVKFTAGDYLLVADGSNYGYTNRGGIFIPSFMTLDLTDNVTFHLESNNQRNPAMIRIDGVTDVTIRGGRLIGDKDTHQYPTNGDIHGGKAIDMICSKNITIDGMKMENMLGCGIYMHFGSIMPNERRLVENIKILNCEISNCSLLGMGLIHARNVEIAYTKIFDIEGATSSGMGQGIDAEPESYPDDKGIPQYTLVDHIRIHHCEVRNTEGEGLCFVNSHTTDIEIADNYLDNASIIMNRYPARIRLVRNTLMGWRSYMVARTSYDVYMPMEGPDKNNMEFPVRAANCSTMTGHITETDNYTKCN